MKNIPHRLLEDFRAIARAYTIVIFSGSAALGGLLCVASLLSPWIGLVGVAGTILALFVARRAGFERAAIDDGRLLFNPLLCSLALGCWAPPGTLPPMVMAILIMIVPLVALGCTLILNQATLVLVGVASRSLPFCVVGIMLNWLLTRLIPIAAIPAVIAPGQTQLPALVELWAHSLGTLFFAPSLFAGLLATLALAVASRLSLGFALVGFVVSSLLLLAMGFSLEQSSWLQLDAILCAVALGGVFYVPSRTSLALAAFGAVICIVTGVALLQGLRWIDAPLLTLPFNLVVLGVTGAMRWRAAGHEPRAVLYPGRNPEATFQNDRLWQARHPESELPAMVPPFEGVWVVTQGFDDHLTHRAAWKHALDFEVADADGQPDRAATAELNDFPSFNAPIFSPADGRVVRLVDSIADNSIGESNLAENWGNSVVIEITPSLFVQLSHFRRRGFKVREGDRVRTGQLLGYLGNSGRSPVPHLHVQMQALPDIGSPTIPFRLVGYRTPASEGRWNYHFRGLPRAGDTLAAARSARWMEECFTRGEEKSSTYRVFTAQGEFRETIRQEWVPDGSLVLHSVETGARARLIVMQGQWTPTEVRAGRPSLLEVLSVTGRIPLAPLAGAHWEDFSDASPGANWRERLSDELLAPFLSRPLSSSRVEMTSCDELELRFALSWATPGRSKAELLFQSGVGLVSGRIETRRHWLHFLAVDQPAPAAPGPPASLDRATREFALV